MNDNQCHLSALTKQITSPAPVTSAYSVRENGWRRQIVAATCSDKISRHFFFAT